MAYKALHVSGPISGLNQIYHSETYWFLKDCFCTVFAPFRVELTARSSLAPHSFSNASNFWIKMFFEGHFPHRVSLPELSKRHYPLGHPCVFQRLCDLVKLRFWWWLPFSVVSQSIRHLRCRPCVDFQAVLTKVKSGVSWKSVSPQCCFTEWTVWHHPPWSLICIQAFLTWWKQIPEETCLPHLVSRVASMALSISSSCIGFQSLLCETRCELKVWCFFHGVFSQSWFPGPFHRVPA